MPAAVVRWRFEDPRPPGEDWTFEVSPNAMTSPFAGRRLDIATTTAVDGQPLLTEGQRQPKEWSFSGVILSDTQYAELLRWSKKKNRIFVHDHFERRYDVVLVDFIPVPGRKSMKYPFHHTYTMNCLVLGITVENPLSPGTYVEYVA